MTQHLHAAEVVETTPRVRVSFQGGRIPLRTSEHTYAVETGDTLLIAMADDGSYYAVARVEELDRVTGNFTVDGDLNVGGAKNAKIPDPDQSGRMYRFAAMESDRPGILEHEAEVTQGDEYALPEWWARIAKNLRVTSLQPLESRAGHAWPEINRDAWTVTVRGQPGRYWMVARATRADSAVDGWTHVIEPPEPEPDESEAQ